MEPRLLTLDMPVRWNSTFEMIDLACKLQIPITAVCATQNFDQSMKELILTSEDWLLLQEVVKLLNIFVRPSKRLQGSVYPTLNYAIPQYLKMLKKLESCRTLWGVESVLGQACTAAHVKLSDYYTLIRGQSHAVVATICDPRFNLNVFKIL